ncbi:glycosyltransferase family 2 protein [Carnimonas bestiolae]|uniref:glycosyltransferase family 2 protein n=1 Tax=Carnimonas bestiolae TaxID=3402172 RepID=UPI003EDC6155
MRTCLLLVLRNQESQLPSALKRLRPLNLPILAVDDGSQPMEASRLNDTASQHNIELIRLVRRSGQGTATKVGLDEAQRLGYTHALQCDVDIEFNADELAALLKESELHPDTLFYLSTDGTRLKIPLFVSIVARIAALHRPFLQMRTGLRLYPTALANQLLSCCTCSSGRGFSNEFTVRWYWRNLPTVGYPLHIEREVPPLRFDLGKAAAISARLMLGMVLRLPFLVRRYWVNREKEGERA